MDYNNVLSNRKEAVYGFMEGTQEKMEKFPEVYEKLKYLGVDTVGDYLEKKIRVLKEEDEYYIVQPEDKIDKNGEVKGTKLKKIMHLDEEVGKEYIKLHSELCFIFEFCVPYSYDWLKNRVEIFMALKEREAEEAEHERRVQALQEEMKGETPEIQFLKKNSEKFLDQYLFYIRERKKDKEEAYEITRDELLFVREIIEKGD